MKGLLPSAAGRYGWPPPACRLRGRCYVAAGPLEPEALARFSARTALLPRTNPVAETAAASSCSLAVDERMKADAGATTALHRDVGDFGDLPALFGYRQNGLAVLTRERQRRDQLVAICRQLHPSDTGLSTRRYPLGLEPVGEQITEKATATSKSAVSRRFVAMTETALAELLSQDLSGLDLVALMIDGVHFAESCCIVALGIGIDGVKHPLALVEGSTENATLVTDLLVDLRERGLDVTRPMLVGLDGSKALRKAVLDVLDHPVIQRCQLHKVRNVKDHLPQRLRSSVGRKMTDAYHADSALEAEAALLALAKELDRTHPGAAASLREGLDETLTVLRLGVPPTLARTLRSTNCIESMISVCREHAGNVKRWRDGQMALRWCAAGMVEAGKQFRRVNGHLHLPLLRAALERNAEPVAALVHNEQVSAA